MEERRIHKYIIMDIDHTIRPYLIMPRGAVVLSVGWQDRVGVVVWAAVRPEEEMVNHEFTLAPTGGEPGPGRFVGTVQMPTGIVAHLFVDD